MMKSKIMKITCILTGVFIIINSVLIYNFYKLVTML